MEHLEIKQRIMKELPEGYKITVTLGAVNSLIGPGERTLLQWYMDGKEEGFYEIRNVTATSKEEIKEILAAMTAYLEGAK